ncbi:MAG: type VI secretion system transmembrane protein TssO [Oceanihabitans sp.]
MKPQNSKERRSSFIKFLLLFLVTMFAVIFAIYFNYKVPNKENDLLRGQAKVIQEDLKFQNNFYSEMEQVKNLIDSLDEPGQNSSYQNSLISTKLVELQKTIPTKDSTYRYDMYMSIVKLHAELQEYKAELKSLQEAKTRIEEYKTALDKCKTDLKQTERDLFIARGQ